MKYTAQLYVFCSILLLHSCLYSIHRFRLTRLDLTSLGLIHYAQARVYFPCLPVVYFVVFVICVVL